MLYKVCVMEYFLWRKNIFTLTIIIMKTFKVYGQNVLHMACSYNNVKLIDFLLKNYNDDKSSLFDRRLLFGTTYGEKQTPFHYCCRYNSYDAAKCLANTYKISKDTEHSKILEARDYQNRTPFYLAAEYGNTEIVKLLLELGANIEITNTNGQKALYWIISKCPDIVNIVFLILFVKFFSHAQLQSIIVLN